MGKKVIGVLGGLGPEATLDTFGDAKPRFLSRGKKRRSVLTLSIPRASARGVEWVDFFGKIIPNTPAARPRTDDGLSRE